jgi:hypothetical protein
MKHSTGKPTKAEEKRFQALHKIGCIACLKLHLGSVCEIHHIVDRGTRKASGGHMATLPLCLWHHRGIPPTGISEAYWERIYGPSFALNKKAFIERFGNERTLLEEVDELIARRFAA